MATVLQPPQTEPPRPAPAAAPPGGGWRSPVAPEEPGARPAGVREIAAVAATVLVFDLWIYRGSGFAGYAAFFAAAAALLLLGSSGKVRPGATALVGGMVLVLAVRLVWLGNAWLATLGFLLLVAFAMAAKGRRPYVLDLFLYAAQSLVAGFPAVFGYGRVIDRGGVTVPRTGWLKVLLPLAAVLLFGTVFVLANPDVVEAFTRGFRRSWDFVWNSLSRFSPDAAEVVLWGVVAVVTGGLLRPLIRSHLLAPLSREWWGDTDAEEPLFETSLYPAFRNTLAAVTALFAVYLVFEFRTLWFRTFPKGFYYAGYAHEGAAWLTVALAMTTFVLGAIFRGATMRDPRLPRLRRLAWAWSALNLLLALAVYHRMLIYIDFNGMTRMRTVGLFGITAVVVGFLLVVVKIAKDRDFAWLIERQLWTLALAIVLLSVTPVDYLVHFYNVRRVLAGDAAPSVQISVHPINDGGVLALPPLLNCDDPILREGARSILAERAIALGVADREPEASDWTAYQIAEHKLRVELTARRADWEIYLDAERRAAARKRFDQYAYQWY
jgi:hypothetical protein